MTERDTMAAEYALRLLEGEELFEARRLVADDPGFAAAVAAWEERLAPLLDEIGEARPSPEMWERIRARIADTSGGSDNVVALRRTLNRWRGFAVAASAAAAALALFVAVEPVRQPAIEQPRPSAPVVVAALAAEDDPTSLTVALQPASGDLLITPGRLTPAAGHDHELWLIPAGGSPLSLGLVRAGAPQRRKLTPVIAAQFEGEATLALSVEPTGGSATGLPTGPVIASGKLALL